MRRPARPAKPHRSARDAHFKSNALLDVPETDQTSPHASAGSETASLPIAAEVRGDGHRRALQAAPANRRRGYGLGLDGRPDRTGQTPGRGQAHPRRTRSVADDPVAVRGRAAGDRADGPPAYRQAARRRHDGRGLTLLRHGTGQGNPAQRILRRPQARAFATGSSSSCRSARPCSMPTRRGSSTAT